MITSLKDRYLSSDTFTNTANGVFRLITSGFILVNYISLRFFQDNNSGSNLMLLALVSLIQLSLLCFIEPYISKQKIYLVLIIYLSIGACSGVSLLLHYSSISLSVFFTSIVAASLRLPLEKSIAVSVFYYLSCIISAIYSKESFSAYMQSNLLDVHILVILLSTSYICHYFSKIECEKDKQDEAIIELVSEKNKLTQSLGDKNTELDDTYWDMVETLIGVIETRDRFTGGHSVKVCEYAVKLARKIGLSDKEISCIMKAAILHDIGKMGIPENILLKPSALSGDEYGTIMNHPEIGYRILSNIKGLEEILPLVLYHHEKIDGSGYPYGVDGERIPTGAKIISIADAYDAMTSDRPYRKALLKKEAKKRLMDGAGTQFQPEYINRFIELIDDDNIEDLKDHKYVDNIKRSAKIR